MPNDATLGATVREALRLMRIMKVEGNSQADMTATLERTLRAAWPFIREWKYLCEDCLDCGLGIVNCPDVPCGRRQMHQPHTYGMPCFCREGARYLPKAESDDPSKKRRGHVRP